VEHFLLSISHIKVDGGHMKRIYFSLPIIGVVVFLFVGCSNDEED
jgi:hypothetical protein